MCWLARQVLNLSERALLSVDTVASLWMSITYEKSLAHLDYFLLCFVFDLFLPSFQCSHVVTLSLSLDLLHSCISVEGF